MKIDHALEVRELGLKPDQKLLVCLKAADRRDRDGGPNVGASQRWLLDVVTPERLRIMLQSRELVLRQRFEMIIQEVTETRDSLLRMEFAAASASRRQADRRQARGGRAGRRAGRGASGADSPERSAALRSLRCERAVQNCRKNAAETLGAAEAFDAIRLELVNNRIDTEELKIRLASGIAEPLRQIGDAMFPELEKRLVQLRKTLDDPNAGPQGPRLRARAGRCYPGKHEPGALADDRVAVDHLVVLVGQLAPGLEQLHVRVCITRHPVHSCRQA